MPDDAISFGAVDIGGTKIAVGLVREDGSIAAERSLPTASVQGWLGGVQAIRTAMLDCERESGLKPRAIGVGCTGPVNPLTGVVGKVALLPGWQDAQLVDALSQGAGLPVAMENDADAAALGELIWGSGEGAARFLYVTVSTGIGVGFICDGELYRGAGGAHPEMGHHVLDGNGPACYCGGHGCWESLASGTALESWFQQRTRHGTEGGQTTARTIFHLASTGDAVALEAVERLVHYLGGGLANLTNIFVPDVIALGGGVMRSMPVYMPKVAALVHERCGEVPTVDLTICLAGLQEHVGLAGAAAVARAHLRKLTSHASG